MHLLRYALFCLLALALTFPATASADITVGEAAAGITGSALWEINPDATGALTITDAAAPAILKVNPTTGDYTRYVFSRSYAYLVQPMDAKPDAGGSLWWGDGSAAFGRLDPAALQVEYWNLASRNLAPAGFAFDATGRLWFTQFGLPQLLRFNPADRTLCRFSVGGGGDYVVSQGNLLWLADYQAGRLLRFDASNNQLRAWTLPAGWQTPESVVLDPDGRAWWTDSGAGVVGRLTPATNAAVVVSLPAGALPIMAAWGTDVLWYTDGGGQVGFVDPALAGGAAQTLGVATATISPTNCETLPAGTAQAVTRQTGVLSFAAVQWAAAPGQPGVTRYSLPAAGATPQPWGVALSQGRAWTVDRLRNTLARTPRLPQAPVAKIKPDAGGNRVSWEAVTLDEGGGGVTVASYQVWRGAAPYFRPWDAGVTLAGTTSGSFVLDPTQATPAAPVFYGVRSVAQSGLLSQTSGHVGAFAYTLVK